MLSPTPFERVDPHIQALGSPDDGARLQARNNLLRELSELDDGALQRIMHSAVRSTISDLPNAAAFSEKVTQLWGEIEAGTPAAQELGRAAVIGMDVINFGALNRTYGEAAGDAVLRRIGTVITRHTRREASPGRPADLVFDTGPSVGPLEDDTSGTGFNVHGDEFKMVLASPTLGYRLDLPGLAVQKTRNIVEDSRFRDIMDDFPRLPRLGMRAGIAMVDPSRFPSAAAAVEASDPKTRTHAEVFWLREGTGVRLYDTSPRQLSDPENE